MGAIGNATTNSESSAVATEQTVVKNASNYFSNSEVEQFKALEGENRADLINQVAKMLNGGVGGNTLYSTKNGINVGDYQITLSTKKDKKLGKQVITDMIVMHRKDKYKDMKMYVVR